MDNGQGVPVDLREAVRYLKMTVDQGHADARQGGKRVVDMTGKLNSHTDGVERSTDFIVNHVKEELKPLSEWIVDVSDLEDVGGDLISRGSESVRLFRQKGNGKVIAGKVVIADDSGEGEKEFKREISSLFSLDHPCVLKFAGCALLCSLTDHRFLIFTEYVSGGSLSVVIEDPAPFAWFNSAGRTIVVVGIVLGMMYTL